MADYAAALEAYNRVLMEQHDKPVQEFDAARVCAAREKVHALKPKPPTPSSPDLDRTMLVPVMEKILRTEGETEEQQHPGESQEEMRKRRNKEYELLDKLSTWVFKHCAGEKPVRLATASGITFKLEGVCRYYNLYAKREDAPDDKYVCVHIIRD